MSYVDIFKQREQIISSQQSTSPSPSTRYMSLPLCALSPVVSLSPSLYLSRTFLLYVFTVSFPVKPTSPQLRLLCC